MVTAPVSTFFRRLEDQHRGSGEVPVLRQISGRSQKHGAVTIMAAGMHDTRRARRMVRRSALVDRKGIHVGTQANCGAFAIAPNDRNHPAASDVLMQLIHADLAQTIGDEGGRFRQVVEQFRVLVQPVSPLSDFGNDIGDAVMRRMHGKNLC